MREPQGYSLLLASLTSTIHEAPQPTAKTKSVEPKQAAMLVSCCFFVWTSQYRLAEGALKPPRWKAINLNGFHSCLG
jgi:hypothetical protein